MREFNYKPKGVCASLMQFKMNGNQIREVHIKGGCAGNLLGISNMLQGKNINEVLSSFEGVKCGFKNTSCPDQIAYALKQYRDDKKEETN